MELRHISFARRFLYYGITWLLAVIAFQIFLRPEGPTETDVSAFEQRLWLPFYTPVIVFIGFTRAVAGISHSGAWSIVISLVCLIGVGITTLTQSRCRPFMLMVGIHSVLLVIGVLYAIRVSRLPGDG